MSRTRKRDLTMEEQLARGPIDLPFLMLVTILTVVGAIMVFSASYPTAINEGKDPANYFFKQAGYGAGGLVAMYVISKINYQRFRWMSMGVLAASYVLLILVLPFGYGRATVGAQRWMSIAGISFQPSEIAKVGVILYFAARLSKRDSEKPKKLNPRSYWSVPLGLMQRTGFLELIPYAVILGSIAILMMLEPHMSGTILILVGGAAVLFAAGIHMGWFVAGGACMGVLLILMMSGYQSTRILVWRNPWDYYATGESYQIIQSLYTIGSGGLLGVGLGKGRQKFLFLPEPENDFIFPVICEELGLVGACVILFLFALLILRGFWIAIHARDRFGALLTVGIMTLLAVQVFLNVAVVTNLIPTTGISLPFFSYGGTALLIQLAEMGMVLSVSRQIPASKQG
ncbi:MULTISPECIES: putative peptidoglycan glycosyltransferase FtsW [unclassified Flavonifractor]|uniref:FtsW/RodA/SpoVE family cell cycle protein n=1 Tax=Flavonifractor sp. An92 TaxID=1965666 RepID=UPI001FA8DB5D|nr:MULTISPECIES: putative peptidoglycan glycosyltransferase FtsW [unclassified Flavonifractor]